MNTSEEVFWNKLVRKKKQWPIRHNDTNASTPFSTTEKSYKESRKSSAINIIATIGKHNSIIYLTEQWAINEEAPRPV
jgi:hypothetical protein